jgi:hypothetical protein
MIRLIGSLLVLLTLAGIAAAQKGTAEPGFYPSGFHGDTWTGEVTAADEDTREFTLTYKSGDKEKTFVGILPPGFTVKLKDRSNHRIEMKELLGVRLKAYYIVKTKKVNDQDVKTNEVFDIKFLPQNK